MVQQFYVRYHYHEHHFTVLSIISFSYTNNTRYNSFGYCTVLLYSPTLKRFHPSHLGPAHLVPAFRPIPIGPVLFGPMVVSNFTLQYLLVNTLLNSYIFILKQGFNFILCIIEARSIKSFLNCSITIDVALTLHKALCSMPKL